MRVDLGSLTGMDTDLQLPLEGDGSPKRLRLRKLHELSGVLERANGVLRLSDVRAGEVNLGGADWLFGTVRVHAPQPCHCEGLQLDMTASDAPIELSLDASLVRFTRLEIEVGDTRVSGVARMDGAELRLAKGQGTIRARQTSITDLQVQIGELSIKAPELSVDGLEIGWGDPDGFRMAAHTTLGPRVEIRIAGVTLNASHNDLRGFEVKHGGVFALSHQAELVEAALELDKPSDSAPKNPAAPETQPELAAVSRRLFDLNLLDALVGQIVADSRFEVRLPGGLRRKLHIPLNLEVVEGSIDYRALEHSLPTFEDSLLDFSRDGDWLALELGLPLLPTRGHGKQLMRWPLRSPDGTTREGHLVRLAALPQYERPGSRASKAPERESTSGSGKSSVRLDRASVKVGPMQLRLPPPSQYLDAALEILAFDEAHLEGHVEHATDECPPGELRARIEGLEARIDQLRAGARTVGATVLARHVGSLQVTLGGFTPRGFRLRAEGLQLKGVAYH